MSTYLFDSLSLTEQVPICRFIQETKVYGTRKVRGRRLQRNIVYLRDYLPTTVSIDRSVSLMTGPIY